MGVNYGSRCHKHKIGSNDRFMRSRKGHSNAGPSEKAAVANQDRLQNSGSCCLMMARPRSCRNADVKTFRRSCYLPQVWPRAGRQGDLGGMIFAPLVAAERGTPCAALLYWPAARLRPYRIPQRRPYMTPRKPCIRQSWGISRIPSGSPGRSSRPLWQDGRYAPN